MKHYGYGALRNTNISGAEVLVIGGTSGIGEEICKHLSQDVTTDCPTKVVAVGLEDFQVQQVWWPSIFSRYGNPHKIVYCAGENHLNWLGDNSVTRSGFENVKYLIRDMFATNVIGFIDMIDQLAHCYNEPANVVAISSDAAVRPLRTSIGYCASKAALDMAVRVAARELGPHGWRINAVAPGMVADTPMSAYIDKRVPYIRGWTPEQATDYEVSQEVTPGRVQKWEVAQVVADVLDGPPHLNGTVITVNGGR